MPDTPLPRANSIMPELFASTVAPGSWKRKKQAWPTHISKGRRPKRSNVKYPRPFDDDLPW